jgi:2-keto-4-pentenoate hydratase/2-oxohepta-3-ene-1,7-dioic acid hydratase in catechol pathway
MINAKNESMVRYARYRAAGKVAYGIVEGDRVRAIAGDLFGSWEPTETTHALDQVELLVPSAAPKVLAVGINYRSHLGTRAVPEVPAIFLKATSSLLAHDGTIVIPGGTSDVHYEGEMVVVMGRRTKDVSESEARDHILGVTCGNDVSARDWQKNDLQWWRAKGSDTFGPCGPFIASGLNYDDLAIALRLNGEVKQSQRTSDLIFPVAEIVSWISRHVTLEPGDLIYTGTPGTTSPLEPGDVVEVELEGVGILRSTVKDS